MFWSVSAALSAAAATVCAGSVTRNEKCEASHSQQHEANERVGLPKVHRPQRASEDEPSFQNEGAAVPEDQPPGAGCSITSTATVSITGAAGCFNFRTAFFTDARLGLAFATVFARAALLALLRLAEFPLVNFPRFCTFDFFFDFAMMPSRWLRNTSMAVIRLSARAIQRYQQSAASRRNMDLRLSAP